MKSILIIGMGKFGHHLCADLIKNGNDIMVMDKDEAKVRDLIYDVTKVQIGDCTDPQVVKALGINNFDLIFVCIGTNFQSSLEITSLVKEINPASFAADRGQGAAHVPLLDPHRLVRSPLPD